MKLTFKNGEFEKVLRDLVRVVPSSTSRAVLKHVLIKATRDEDRVDLYASSEDMSIRRTLFEAAINPPVVIDSEGACLVPARELFEIVKLANGPITFESQKDKTVIRFGKAHYELASLDPEMFTPYDDDSTETTTLTIAAPELHRLLRRTTYATATGTARPILNGVKLSIVDTSLHAVGTDGLRLAQYGIPCSFVSGEERFIVVGSDLLNKLTAALPAKDDDEEVTVNVGTSACTVTWSDDEYRMVLRGLDGVYPNVAQIIPRNTPHNVVLDRQAFLAACERVSILSETEHQRAQFTFSKDSIVITSTSAQFGKAEDAVDLGSSTLTSGMEFLCNINYWIGMLRSYEGVQQIEIDLIDPLKPLTVKPVGGEGLGLIAPFMKTAETKTTAA